MEVIEGGGVEGRQIYFTGLPSFWRVFLMEQMAQEKAKGYLGENKGSCEVSSTAQVEGKRVTPSSRAAHSWVRQQSEGPHR